MLLNDLRIKDTHKPADAVGHLSAECLADEHESMKRAPVEHASMKHCNKCQLLSVACMCGYRPKLTSTAEFCLLMHEAEFRKPTNTGRLIADCFAPTRIYKWHRTEPDPSFLSHIANTHYQHWLVFPAEETDQASRIKPFELTQGKTNSFILLDATWQQAAKMFRRSPYLNHLPILSLNPETLSQYSLRRTSQSNHLCTAEIAVELLGMVKEPQNAVILDDYFQVFSQHYQAARSGHGVKKESEQMKRLVEFNQ